MRNKILTSLLGLVAVMILLELILRLVGVVHTSSHKRAVLTKEVGDFVILCVGDSFTEGIGATANNDYPSQLQLLLQQRFPNKVVRVVNRGVGGFNTSMVMSRMDKLLQEVLPDLVIVLVGSNNRWNVYGYSQYLDQTGWWGQIYEKFSSFKILRLYELLKLGVASKQERDQKRTDNDKNVVSLYSHEDYDPSKLEWVQGRYDEAIEYYKRELEAQPNDLRKLIAVGRLYWKKKDKVESRRYYQMAVNVNPAKTVMAYADYASKFILNKDPEPEELQFLEKHKNISPVVKDILEVRNKRSGYDDRLSFWIAHDASLMIRKSRELGADVIVLNYPNFDGALDKINATLRFVAQRAKALFVDNEAIFRNEHSVSASYNPYSAFDRNHCNDKGYAIIASNILKMIVDARLIP